MDAAAWRRALQACVDMDDARFQAASAACLEFARRWPAESNVLEMNAALFEEAVGRRLPLPDRAASSPPVRA